MLKLFSLDNTVASKTIVKGLTSSIGWNLGKKNKLNQRLDPLTSTPIMGTNTKKNNEIKNKSIDILNRWFWLIDEKKIIISTPIQI